MYVGIIRPFEAHSGCGHRSKDGECDLTSRSESSLPLIAASD